MSKWRYVKTSRQSLSWQGAFLQPVDIEPPFRKQPCAVDLYERIKVAKIGNHQAPLFGLDFDVMRNAVGFPGASVVRQGRDSILSNKVHGGVVLIKIGEDRTEFLA